MKQIFIFTLTLFLCLHGTAATAQNPLRFDDVFSGRLIQTEGSGTINWLKDGERYSRLEYNAETGGMDVVAYRAKDNKRELLIPSSLFINKATGKPLPIRSITWSDDNQKVLIYNNTQRVWRYDTRGDYWVLNLTDNKLQQIGKGLPESSLMFAKFSPDATRVAYVSKNNIYVEELASETITQLTFDGNETIVNGTFDWVYEEEFSCRDGFRWSPDGKQIAYWQSDTEGTGVFDIINNVDQLYPTILHFPYPKAGTANSAVKVGFIAATGGKTTWIDIPGDPRNNYLPRMEFIPESNELFIQQLNRPQNTNTVWIVDLNNPTPQNIFTDRDDAWLDTNDNIQWLQNNTYFTWESERSGWRHLYRVSRDGKEILPITQGEFDYISPVGMDKQKGLVYFMASPDNFTQRYLYSARLMGKGEVQRLSPIDQAGQHRYTMSPTGKWAVHTFHNAVTPPVISMVSFPKHQTARVIVDNQKGKEQYDALGLRPKEFLKVRSGDLLLDAWIIKPIHFDATKKYPVIIDVYGEPASATVQDAWGGGDLWHQYLANLGYLIVSIENRGANTPRGREWRKCIYGEVGTFASEDQCRGIMDMVRQFSYIDPSRIGITGWSGGGSQTLNCMFRYPDVFLTGIAVAFVADQRLYDTIYQERYMNTPQANPEGYRKGSPITYVEGLQGNLLLIHGTGDDNVHYQNCELLVNKLIEHEKVFSQISYPMRSHSISEGKGTTRHLRKSMEKYWLDYLPAGGR
ncbi:dipeptidyl-peptidase-4 [Parabacteroides sp. PFB2-12]|uniref:S9 family peptidase n=1 Tax=unclassified Parabacteroides TaxID=2649774 RepID=UPI002475573B|nr:MULTISPECIES: S9 family peptidase [unclassified Parabacteroides]MDH6341252.1 dipeptidyl-peptidase-4 [Parabacteroides sp. PM6-13]MDH6389044.1 dipeptidyl-peptidase-4 [Parabacteroides sp. PFB2-12]